jgi:hypothetical protein
MHLKKLVLLALAFATGSVTATIGRRGVSSSVLAIVTDLKTTIVSGDEGSANRTFGS